MSDVAGPVDELVDAIRLLLQLDQLASCVRDGRTPRVATGLREQRHVVL